MWLSAPASSVVNRRTDRGLEQTKIRCERTRSKASLHLTLRGRWHATGTVDRAADSSSRFAPPRSD
jgi:hypothetical protein